GGTVVINAGTRVQISGQVLANGFTGPTSAGDGGEVDITAQFGNLTINTTSDILADGTNPDGIGGVIRLNTPGALAIQAGTAANPTTISARSRGSLGAGGSFSLQAGTTATLAGGSCNTPPCMLDVSAGGGGGDITVMAGADLMLQGPANSKGT